MLIRRFRLPKKNTTPPSLTDPETRKNWEEYGNPDGPVSRSYGIALPSWLVQRENKAVILLFYGILFMVVLPVSVVRL